MRNRLSGIVCWTFLLIILSSGKMFSQTFVSSEAELKKQADKYFNAEKYEAALPDYSRLLSLYPQEPLFNYRFGVCLLLAGKEKANASTYLEVASKDQKIPEEVWYFLGRSYMVNNDFNKAIDAFAQFKKTNNAVKLKKYDADASINNCISGNTLVKSRKNIVISGSNEVTQNAFYNNYDFGELSGKVVNTADQFLTNMDRTKQKDPVMFISNDKNTVLISSYGKKGDSGKDLYIIRRTPDNQWSDPENLGSGVNTKADEDFPYLDRDGRTLYFSSQGHNSIGGYDLFKSVYDFNTREWSQAENLGIPINTIGDDFLYVPDHGVRTATYSTNVESVLNSVSIRKIQLPGGMDEMLTISGVYVPIDQQVRRDARISILTSSGEGIVTSVHTDPRTGRYELVLPPGETYMIVVEGGGYLPHAEYFELPAGMVNPDLKQVVKLNKESQKEELTLQNYFASAGQSSEPTKTITHSFSSAVDSAHMMGVKINDQLVYVTPPTMEAPESLSDNSNSENDSSSITIRRRTISESSVEAEKDETVVLENEHDSISKGDDNQVSAFKANMTNEELANIAYEDAKEIQDEVDSLKREASFLRNQAREKEKISAELKENAEAEGLAVDSVSMYTTQSETFHKEAEDANLFARAIEKEAAARDDEAKIAFADANSITKGSKKQNPGLSSIAKNKNTKTIVSDTNSIAAEKEVVSKEELKTANADVVVNDIDKKISEKELQAPETDLSKIASVDQSTNRSDATVVPENAQRNGVSPAVNSDAVSEKETATTEIKPADAIVKNSALESTSTIVSNNKINNDSSVISQTSLTVETVPDNSINTKENKLIPSVENVTDPIVVNGANGENSLSQTNSGLPVVAIDQKSGTSDTVVALNAEAKSINEFITDSSTATIQTESTIATTTIATTVDSSMKIEDNSTTVSNSPKENIGQKTANAEKVIQPENENNFKSPSVQDSSATVASAENSSLKQLANIPSDVVESEKLAIQTTSTKTSLEAKPATKNETAAVVREQSAPATFVMINGSPVLIENKKPVAKSSAKTSTVKTKSVSHASVKPEVKKSSPVIEVAEKKESQPVAVDKVPVSENTISTSVSKEKLVIGESPSKNSQLTSDQKKKDPVVKEEARVAYRDYQSTLKHSNELTAEAVEMQTEISHLHPSPRRDTLIRIANEKSFQSVKAWQQALAKVKEARTIDPEIDYKMNVIDYNASHPDDIISGDSTSGLATNAGRNVETESESELLDTMNAEYPVYKKIKQDITKKQEETIDVFAEAVNLSKLSLEENDKAMMLMDKAHSESDAKKRNEYLKQSDELKALSAKHEQQSKEKFTQAQKNTKVVKGLRTDLLAVRERIILPKEKGDAFASANKSNTNAIENSLSNNATMRMNGSGVNSKLSSGGGVTVYENEKNKTMNAASFAMAERNSVDMNASEEDVADVKVTNESRADFLKNIFTPNSITPYSEKNPIPMDPSLPEGLVFKIQVGAFHKPIPANSFGGLQPVTGENTRPGWIRYCVGLFKTFEPANIVKNEIKRNGYKDAFVVAYFNGKRIELNDAYVMLKGKENLTAYKAESAKEMAMLRSINIKPDKSYSLSDDKDVLAFYAKQPLKEVLEGEAGETTVTKSNAETTGGVKSFTVQVGVYKTSNAPAALAAIDNLEFIKTNSGMYRFISGKYSERTSAEVARRQAVNAGVKDAFIVPYTGGSRANINQSSVASVLKKKQGEEIVAASSADRNKAEFDPRIVYKVQIGAFKKDMPYTVIESYLSISDKGITRQADERGLFIFYVGSFGEFNAASLLREEVAGKGVKDAFVVAIQNGRRIPISDEMKK